MMDNKIKRINRYKGHKQSRLNKRFAYILIMNVLIALSILFNVLTRTCQNNQIEDGNTNVVYESKIDNDHSIATPSANVLATSTSAVSEQEEILPEIEEEVEEETEEYSRNISENDKYLLAKLAMAEAEGESLEAKLKIICVVLNRVESNEVYFPDTIEEVIFKESEGVFQFTPISDGRWDMVEPNDECWEAVNIVNTTDYDFAEGALYFEACAGESWHSRNLEFICQVDHTRFYK